MSHEIRTPLNAITGFAQLLQLKLEPDKQAAQLRMFVDHILQGSDHLMALINDVLDLQKVESGVLSLHMEALQLVDEVSQCVGMLQPLASQRQVILSTTIPAAVRVLADRQRLRQVLMNVGSNAIKYNQAGGQVDFILSQTAAHFVTLTVKDTGPGMSSTELSKLFQPFERLGHETSGIEGTGLGLIITRSLIDAMGGSLQIESQPGSGTQVHIALPLASLDLQPPKKPTLTTPDQTARQVPTSSSEDRKLNNAPLHVLYVEDNRINAMLFEEALRPYPELTLDIAEDGQMALAMAREKRPDVLVLDAHLPGMTGFEVLEALRTLPGLSDTPAFMCSADAMPDDLARAKAAGFTGYWTKPIDIMEVTSVLRGLAKRGDNAAP